MHGHGCPRDIADVVDHVLDRFPDLSAVLNKDNDLMQKNRIDGLPCHFLPMCITVGTCRHVENQFLPVTGGT